MLNAIEKPRLKPLHSTVFPIDSSGREGLVEDAPTLGSAQAAAPDSSFLLMQTLGGSSEGSSGWVPAIHMGEPDGVPSLPSHLSSLLPFSLSSK